MPKKSVGSKKDQPAKKGAADSAPEEVSGQKCPFCNANTLTLTECEKEIPYFGRVYLFSMTCTSCKYHKADVESVETHPPCKYTIDVSGEEDLSIRIVKSSEATVRIPHIISMEPGPSSNGYVTNVEGLFMRAKNMIESAKENEDDPDAKKTAIKLIKKINRAIFGQDKLKIIIEDPSGNSAIISPKAVKGKL